MSRFLASVAVAMMFCSAVSFAEGAQRGRGGAKPGGGRSAGEGEAERERSEGAGRESSRKSPEGVGAKSGENKSPGGAWSERTHSGPTSNAQHGGEGEHSAAGGAAAGSAASKNKSGQPSGAQAAAAGAAAANKNGTSATGKQGAAAGAAAANRNSPTATGAKVQPLVPPWQIKTTRPQRATQGAAAGAAAANRNSPEFSGAGRRSGSRRRKPQLARRERRRRIRGRQRLGQHRRLLWRRMVRCASCAWAPTGWGAGAVWAPTSWNTFAGMYGYGNAAPLSYNYGSNVMYQDGNVLVAGSSVGTAAAFSQQAADLAALGSQADVSPTEKWLPLGVFAMVRNEQQHPQLIVQLAVNEQGILRGNYTDEVTDHTAPIHGAVDKETQRAAWTVGDNKSTVMEAGLNNLTQSEAPALIHKNGKTDHWILVRLEQPPAGAVETESGR